MELLRNAGTAFPHGLLALNPDDENCMKMRPVVHSNPDILGGTPVFVGTRVPVRALIDYIDGGHSLSEFLDDFPTVSRGLAIEALKEWQER